MNHPGQIAHRVRCVPSFNTLGRLLLLSFLAAAPSVVAGQVTIAVVRDGPGPEDRQVDLVEQELANHTPRGTTVAFKSDPSFDAGWSYENAAGALQAAFDDSEVDLVLAQWLERYEREVYEIGMR